ncbi:cell division protein SepF [Vallitalea sp.]|jgi:cell division inhibitor SepF|uniref:cell division protein SepF n=1 Tax=Vallitalea sp. TaxID=1882829 RepID=UPI0025E04C32|nr:cell division protein SepF [Vallitalea sp.]MCT4688491.1 cell division protein SepF [Vallitalea sp.]
MAKFIDKMMDMMKLSDYDDYDEDYEYNEENEEPSTSSNVSDIKHIKSYSKKKSNATNVVNFQANVQMEVVVIQPETYDEAQDICDHIKSKKPVIINLDKMDRNIAQRIMDFISGSCYTLNGNLQRVTNNIFLIAPENVDIAGDLGKELKSNGIILPWKSEQ